MGVDFFEAKPAKIPGAATPQSTPTTAMNVDTPQTGDKLLTKAEERILASIKAAANATVASSTTTNMATTKTTAEALP